MHACMGCPKNSGRLSNWGRVRGLSISLACKYFGGKLQLSGSGIFRTCIICYMHVAVRNPISARSRDAGLGPDTRNLSKC